MSNFPSDVVTALKACVNSGETYYTRTLHADAKVEGESGAWSNENAVVLLDSQGLTPEVLARCKELRQAEAEQPPRGVYVMIPPDFDHLRDEIEPKLLDIGVHVISADMITDHNKKVMVAGAGTPGLLAALTPAMLSGWNEKDVSGYDLSEPNTHDFGPTPMRRGGNNKPWVDVALQKRRAKIAKQSKRRNRK